MSYKKRLVSFDNNIEVSLNAIIYYIRRMYMKFLQKNIRQLIAEPQIKYQFWKYLEYVPLILHNYKKLRKKIDLKFPILSVLSNFVQIDF